MFLFRRCFFPLAWPFSRRRHGSRRWLRGATRVPVRRASRCEPREGPEKVALFGVKPARVVPTRRSETWRSRPVPKGARRSSRGLLARGPASGPARQLARTGSRDSVMGPPWPETGIQRREEGSGRCQGNGHAQMAGGMGLSQAWLPTASTHGLLTAQTGHDVSGVPPRPSIPSCGPPVCVLAHRPFPAKEAEARSFEQ